MPISFKNLPDRVKIGLFDLLSPKLDIEDFWKVRDAYVDGIEATQSIQYYKSERHLTDPALRGMDNAVVLAASKPAWVRAYVRTNRVAPVAGVRGTLTVERRRRGFLWDNVLILNPQAPGTVTARPVLDNDTERSSTLNSLNFILPAADCRGILRLTVRLTDAEGNVLDTSSAVVHATILQTLRLRGILISYNGPATAVMVPNAPPPPTITLVAPTIANLQATAARALLAMPVQSTGSFAIASQITFSSPLDDPRTGAGGCSTNWDALLTRLATERTNDGNRSDVVYFGLLPTGMPINVPGCGVGGLGAGVTGDLATLLHEIGHGYGFAHTPCGAAGTTDPDYPDYKPYPSASIGEYAIDISNGTVFSPATTSDFMSYCFPQWMSLYQYARLIGHSRLAPTWISDNPIWDQYVPHGKFKLPDDIPDPLVDPDPWWRSRVRREAVISIIGVVRSEKEVEVMSVARITAEPNLAGPTVRLRARLLDDNGRELAQTPINALAMHGGCCQCGGDSRQREGEPPYYFQAMIPDVAIGQRLVISDGEDILWERSAPGSPAKFRQVRAKVSEDTANLTWKAETTNECYEVWVQWANPEGRVWHGLATDLGSDKADVSLAPVPGGPALLRLLLHDGFTTAVSEPIPIEVPRRPPAVAILTPECGQTLYAGSPMRLWGSVTDATGAPLGEESSRCRWLLDGQEVGHATDLWLSAPAPGEHRATLIGIASGEEARDTVHFTTIGGYREEC
jgi:hypothetical protein